MDYDLCERFRILVEHYPDELKITEEHDIHHIAGIRDYCPNGNLKYNICITELDKINAACLWLFNKNIANRLDDLSKDQVESFIIYIMIWLNYKLNLKNDEQTNLNNLYTKHIENNENYTNCKSYGKDCSNKLKEKTGYNDFKEIMNKRKDLLSINFEDISKFYEAFKLLCKMPTESNEGNLECTEYLEYANNIVGKFNELNGNSSISGDSSYSKVWSTLSNDYDSFKKKCNGFPSLSSIKTTQYNIQSSDVTSSSFSIVKKLILALSIFSAITIFLGIFYK
ncbi:YIR protein, partial [Plasmodium yoelii]